MEQRSMKKKMSYERKIEQIFRRMMLVVLAVVCIIMIVVMAVLLNQRSSISLTNEVDRLSNHIDGYMSQKIASVEAAVATVQSGTVKGYEEQLAFVDSLMATDEMVSAVYIAYPDESLVYSGGWIPEEGFILTNRPWYTGATSMDGVYLTNPYVDETTGQFCVTLSQAVRIDSKVTCVIGMDLYLDNIISLVSDTFKGSSYSLLTAEDGTIMAHPDEEIALSIDNSQTLETALDGKYNVFTESVGEEHLIDDYSGGVKIMIASNLDCGWKVVSVNPVTELLIPILLTMLLIIIVFTGAVLISGRFCKSAVAKWFEPLGTISN